MRALFSDANITLTHPQTTRINKMFQVSHAHVSHDKPKVQCSLARCRGSREALIISASGASAPPAPPRIIRYIPCSKTQNYHSALVVGLPSIYIYSFLHPLITNSIIPVTLTYIYLPCPPVPPPPPSPSAASQRSASSSSPPSPTRAPSRASPSSRKSPVPLPAPAQQGKS